MIGTDVVQPSRPSRKRSRPASPILSGTKKPVVPTRPAPAPNMRPKPQIQKISEIATVSDRRGTTAMIPVLGARRAAWDNGDPALLSRDNPPAGTAPQVQR